MAAVWAGSLMLDHLGERQAAGRVMDALRTVARNGPWTKDLGGTATTVEVGAAIVTALDPVTAESATYVAGATPIG